MDGELAGENQLVGARFGNERASQLLAFLIRNHPADSTPAEHIEDHIMRFQLLRREIDVFPIGWSQ